MSLRQRTISGIFWSGLSNSSTMLIEFFVGIVLARLLTPDDFGLIGMITIFIGISTIFVNSGFSNALIRKTDCTDDDYATVFIFNLVMAVFLFVLLFVIAPLIGEFYERNELIWLLRFLALSLIISSFTIIQRSQVIQRMDFKLLSSINILASIVSGLVAIGLAYTGFGVWSLVVKTILREFLASILLWSKSAWSPKLLFSKKSFKELFGFGSKLLLSGIIGTTFQNLYYVVIGKYFSAVELGFFTRAEMFRRLPSENVSSTVSSVAYPALAKVKEDKAKLREGFRKIMMPISLVVFVAMLGMMATAEPLVLSLIGDKWEKVIPMLEILCLLGLFVPLNSLNANMLNVVGRSDLYLKTQLFLQLTKVPVVIVGIMYGIIPFLWAMVMSAALSYIVFAYTAMRFTGYTIVDQLRDVLPNLSAALVMYLILIKISKYLDFTHLSKLIMMVLLGLGIFVLSCEIIRLKSYLEIKSILLSKIKTH